jgi:hypothetical protein
VVMLSLEGISQLTCRRKPTETESAWLGYFKGKLKDRIRSEGKSVSGTRHI